MTEIPVYNPLEKRHIAENVMNALLRHPIEFLPPSQPFRGAGIYAIYYTGNFPEYAPIAKLNRDERFSLPIYVGKAIPAGGRKGGFEQHYQGQALYKRLKEHSISISQVDNLSIDDFRCRFLVVDELWIPLGENMIIESFRPLWNAQLDGFGNHDPGSGRYSGKRSPWDMVHPGRPWAAKCQPSPQSAKNLLSGIREYLTKSITAT